MSRLPNLHREKSHHLMLGICPTPPLDSLSLAFCHTTFLLLTSWLDIWRAKNDLWNSVHCPWNSWMKIFLFFNLRASLIKSDLFQPTQIYPHFSQNKGEGVFWPLSPLWRCKRRELDIGISTLILLHPPTVRHNHTCVMFRTNSYTPLISWNFTESYPSWILVFPEFGLL